MILKKPQSIFKTTKKDNRSNEFSKKLLQSITNGLNSVVAKQSSLVESHGLGLDQANKRLNNQHKKELRYSQKFYSDSKPPADIIENVYHTVKPFDPDLELKIQKSDKINDMN